MTRRITIRTFNGNRLVNNQPIIEKTNIGSPPVPVPKLRVYQVNRGERNPGRRREDLTEIGDTFTYITWVSRDIFLLIYTRLDINKHLLVNLQVCGINVISHYTCLFAPYTHENLTIEVIK